MQLNSIFFGDLILLLFIVENINIIIVKALHPQDTKFNY